ncbi:MAG: hypothetical protein JNM40_04720 [Myxococcales bacterium]|nr:hypothetical protein [Myxococcales bacterium]
MNQLISDSVKLAFRRTARSRWLGLLSLCLWFVSGCATAPTIPGTKIADTPLHRVLLQRVEEYRLAMEQREAGKLLTLAHPNYYEDSGTPTAQDDYAFAGLKRVLESRLSSVRWMRYLIRYRDVKVSGDHASVDIRYDLSFQLMTELGEKWERRQNDKRLELIKDGDRWLFISGF